MSKPVNNNYVEKRQGGSRARFFDGWDRKVLRENYPLAQTEVHEEVDKPSIEPIGR